MNERRERERGMDKHGGIFEEREGREVGYGGTKERITLKKKKDRINDRINTQMRRRNGE